ncbi:MAG: helix-turn-helix domain-containing protein [Bacteroides sp.]|nr:helix-turn-helix domain-containing protein [Bacteroides sp.]
MTQFRILYSSILICCFLTICLHTDRLYAQGSAREVQSAVEYTPQIDSLLKGADTLSGIELLRLYQMAHYGAYELNEQELHLQLLRQSMDRVEKDDYDFGRAFLYGIWIEALYNYNLPDSVLVPEALQALEFMRTVRSDPRAEIYYLNVSVIMADHYILSGNYEEALELSEKLYKESRESNSSSGIVTALKCMGRAYSALRFSDKAIESYREVLVVADKDRNVDILCDTYTLLIDIYLKKNQLQDALEMCKAYEDFLAYSETNSGTIAEVIEKYRFNFYLSAAEVYRRFRNYALAGKYIVQAEAISFSQTALGIYTLEDIRFRLLLDQRKFEEAGHSLDRIDREYGEVASFYDKLSLLRYRAQLYYEQGLYDKAADSYMDYILRNDSIKKVEMAAHLNEIRTQYEVDKLEMRQEQDRRLFRNTVWWFSTAVMLLVVIVAVVMVNARRLSFKNRSLVERIREQDKLEADNERLRDELARQDIAVDIHDPQPDRLGQLHLRLKELMKDPAVFTDPEINRRTIADKLGTNEKYIFDTIHTYYDMSIQQYITHIRLNHARKLLAHPAERRTVEDIALESGFHSRATFHRLFKERYGMTPSEFRSLIAGS